MGKKLSFDSNARGSLCRGVDVVARAVRATLGPHGRAVILGRPGALPTITMDGATVAADIELVDRVENVGAQLLREVTEKTQADAGDGTTTATVLARAIVLDGVRHVVSGANPMALKRGIDRAVDSVRSNLFALSRPVTSAEAISQVASLAAGTDHSIGRLVGEVMSQVGADGVVSVEEGTGANTEVRLTEGLAFDSGYLSPYFVTDSTRLEVEFEDAFVLTCTHALTVLDELLPLLERLGPIGRPLVVVAEDVGGEALSTLVVNALRRTLRCVAVKAPGFGDARDAFLGDVAIATGGTLFDQATGVDLRSATPEALGTARRVVIDQRQTMIVEGGGEARALEERCASLSREIEATTAEHIRARLEERRARLSRRAAVIHVGAPTELELGERRGRFEDSLAATRAALHEGVVPGGGVGLIRAGAGLGDLDIDGDERLGVGIIERAVLEPCRRIADNAGVEGTIVVDEVRRLSGAMGFNARTYGYEDLVAAGIVDPTLVVRVALQNAASIGGLMLTTDAVVADRPESEQDGDAESR